MPPRYPVPVGALVRAAVILGVGENSMRVALARLRARGLVRSDERGLYRLGSGAEPVNRHVRSWRSIEDRVGSWDGSWVGLEPAEGTASRHFKLALRLLGFRPLTRTLQVRPDNLAGGVEAVRQRLESLGPAPAGLVFRLAELDAATDRRARGLWDTRALETGYRAIRERLRESEERLRTLSEEGAMAESFLLGGEAVRQIALDPLLPAPIVDVDARRALVVAMRRYDRIGRRCWKAWAGEAVELEQSPAAIGGLAGARETRSAPGLARDGR
jgi:phenylacetic acid degradation operon negative regulatory protein